MPHVEVPEELVERITAGTAVLFLGSAIVACTEDGEPMHRWEEIAWLLSDVVKAHFATSTPLFLCCDLDDPHLIQIYDEVVRRQGRHRARGFAVHPNPSDYHVRFWGRKNLEIIVASSVDFLQTLH